MRKFLLILVVSVFPLLLACTGTDGPTPGDDLVMETLASSASQRSMDLEARPPSAASAAPIEITVEREVAVESLAASGQALGQG